jgi:hypothetical protein
MSRPPGVSADERRMRGERDVRRCRSTLHRRTLSRQERGWREELAIPVAQKGTVFSRPCRLGKPFQEGRDFADAGPEGDSLPPIILEEVVAVGRHASAPRRGLILGLSARKTDDRIGCV